tara:strand:- start:1277 stop:1609 length:333 start_codon:yes stop_codon:yes gene_type:complete
MEDIENICDEVKALLLSKNAQYGDSVLNPINLFANSSSIDGIRIRLDDKYSRLVRGNASIESDEDIHLDCIGYHIMALIAIRREAAQRAGVFIPRFDSVVKVSDSLSDGK